MSFFDRFKKKEDPCKYKMLCKNCDVFFDRRSEEKRLSGLFYFK